MDNFLSTMIYCVTCNGWEGHKSRGYCRDRGHELVSKELEIGHFLTHWISGIGNFELKVADIIDKNNIICDVLYVGNTDVSNHNDRVAIKLDKHIDISYCHDSCDVWHNKQIDFCINCEALRTITRIKWTPTRYVLYTSCVNIQCKSFLKEIVYGGETKNIVDGIKKYNTTEDRMKKLLDKVKKDMDGFLILVEGFLDLDWNDFDLEPEIIKLKLKNIKTGLLLYDLEKSEFEKTLLELYVKYFKEIEDKKNE